jgi:hypothetical protein
MTHYRTRVFTTSIVRLAFVNDFFNRDISWALRRVYVCTIVERNLAEVIADLPVTFPLIRSMHQKAVTIITNGSRGTSNLEYGRSTRATIGSERRLNNPQKGEFSAYGKHGQFTTIQGTSDDEIPLRDEPRQQASATN